MNYPETLDYLYSFINYKLNRQDRYIPNLMPLDRPRRLMALLGNPQDTYPTLHLTGTKGKGSVGAMSAAMLQAAGLRVGLYSSPHLQDFRERIRINGDLISEAQVVALVQDLRPFLQQVPDLTWFEVVTALAFLHFQREKVDLAVIEVGLGGRLDSTNIITPMVSVITSLSLDHMSLLGDTLPEIAAEKAGIIKPGVPVVSAPQAPAALAVIERTAAEQGAPLIVIGRDWQFQPLGGDLILEHWMAAPRGQTAQVYQTVLLGEHQALNATVALAATAQLGQQGLGISPAAQRLGLMQVNWAGRLEIVRQSPFVVLDAAHNGASAACLQKILAQRFQAHPVVLVFAAKADKDIPGMLEALLPSVDHLIITQAIDSRAESPEAIAELAAVRGFSQPVSIISGVAEALQTAEQQAGAGGLVCVAGSLYLVGEARSLYNLPIGQAAYLPLTNVL